MVVDNIPMFSCMCGHSSPNTNTLLIAFFVYCTLTASPSSSPPSPTTVIAMVSHFLFRQCCRHGQHQFSKKDALTNRIHIVGQTHFVSNYPFAGPWRKRVPKPVAHLLRDNSFSFKFPWQSYPLYFLKVSLICNIYLYLFAYYLFVYVRIFGYVCGVGFGLLCPARNEPWWAD